jgi:hypothetical protein
LNCRHIAMVAGGTAVIPVIQMIRAIRWDEWGALDLGLVHYANNTEAGIVFQGCARCSM